MFGSNAQAKNNAALLKALDKSLAIIEFDAKGTVLTANANFCRLLGYAPEEIVGKHHSMFVDADYARSAEYREFWAKLGRGEFDAREYKRIGKGGIEVWIQASYNPVLNSKGVVRRVIKVATDITAEKLVNAEFKAKMDAISLVQAVIEFAPTGEIITANQNFLATMGYTLEEIKGRHHRMFVEPSYAASPGISGVLGQAQPRRAHSRHVRAHRQRRPQSPVAGFLQPDPRCRRAGRQGGQVRH